jgi:hypothetical protein
MRHDRIAENEGLKPRANSRPAPSEPAPQPHPERDHLNGSFLSTQPPSLLRGRRLGREHSAGDCARRPLPVRGAS